MRRALALLALLALPPAAVADERVIPAGTRHAPAVEDFLFPNVLSGPRLVGDEVVWAVRRGEEIVVMADGPRGRRVISRRPGREPGVARPGRTLPERHFSVAADPSRVAISTWAMLCDDDADESCGRYMQQSPQRTELLAGPLAGPVVALRNVPCAVVRAESAGEAVGGDCWPFGGFPSFYLRAADGTEQRFAAASSEQPIGSLAGDLLAVRSIGADGAPAVSVARRATGQELYEVGGDVAHFDLAPDGTLAYVFRDGRPAWSSPSQPGVHALPGAPVTDVVIAGDRVALRTRPPFTTFARFLVAGLDGRPIASHDTNAAVASFDFDGRHLAYARHPCVRPEVRVWDTTEMPPRALRVAGCAMPSVARRRLRVTRAGIVRVPFACRARGRAGCAARVVATARLRGRRGGLGARDLLVTDVLLEPGARTTRTVRLGRRAVARARSGRLELAFDGGGPVALALALPQRR